MGFLGQLYFNDYMSNWRQFEKDMKEIERIPPREYGELLQKKRRSKKRRGKKCRH